MRIESEHVPETTTLTIVLEGREARSIAEQIEVLLYLSPAKRTNSDHLKAFLDLVKTKINNPKPKEDGNKQGDL